MSQRDHDAVFRTIFEHSPVALVFTDAHGRAIIVNRTAIRTFRICPGGLADTNLFRSRNLSADMKRRLRAGKAINVTIPFDFSKERATRTYGTCGTGSIMLDLSITPVSTRSGIIGYLLQATDVTERLQLDRQLATVAELERKRLRHDLHDSVGQQLSAITFLADDLRRCLRGKHSARAAEISRLSGNVMNMVRELARHLIPEFRDAQAFLDALKDLAARIRTVYRVPCLLRCQDRIALPDPHVLSNLYLIAQEAATNAVRHAAPHQIDISLVRRDGRTCLSIHDDGRGLPRARRGTGMGLEIMKHRARLVSWDLSIRSARGKGTTILCCDART